MILRRATVAAGRLRELNATVAVEGRVLDMRFGLGAGALRGFDLAGVGDGAELQIFPMLEGGRA